MGHTLFPETRSAPVSYPTVHTRPVIELQQRILCVMITLPLDVVVAALFQRFVGVLCCSGSACRQPQELGAVLLKGLHRPNAKVRKLVVDHAHPQSYMPQRKQSINAT